jgi:hypothetical protein
MPASRPVVDTELAKLAHQAGWQEVPDLASDADRTALQEQDIDLRVAAEPG